MQAQSLTVSEIDLFNQHGKIANMSNLKKIRMGAGITQEKLAEMMGVTNVTISRYESEDKRLDLPLMRKICKILNCSIAQLAGEEEIQLRQAERTTVDSDLLKQVIKASVIIMGKYQGNPRVTLDWLSGFISVVYEKYHNEKIKEKTERIEDNVIYAYFDGQVDQALKQAS